MMQIEGLIKSASKQYFKFSMRPVSKQVLIRFTLTAYVGLLILHGHDGERQICTSPERPFLGF